MASDKQRREVAGLLRQMADAHYAVEASRVARALGLEYEVYGTVVAFNSAAVQALADLIDRPTCHLVENEDGYTACSECGCTALCMLDAVFCPDCGARVIHKEETNDQ